MKIINEIHSKARQFKSCLLFNGKESFDELIELLMSAQGLEFCLKNNFPELNYFEQFDRLELAKKGVYVNAGIVEISNVENVLLVGNTEAKLIYNNTDVAYKISVLHGATASVHASNYAVVFTNGAAENFEIFTSNNAIVK